MNLGVQKHVVKRGYSRQYMLIARVPPVETPFLTPFSGATEGIRPLKRCVYKVFSRFEHIPPELACCETAVTTCYSVFHTLAVGITNTRSGPKRSKHVVSSIPLQRTSDVFRRCYHPTRSVRGLRSGIRRGFTMVSTWSDPVSGPRPVFTTSDHLSDGLNVDYH